MSNSSSSALARSHGSDRFYCPPAVRRNQQQQQQQRPLESGIRVDSTEPGTRPESDESALSRPNSVGSSSSPRSSNSTNMDRLLASLTPFVPAQLLPEPRIKGRRAPEFSGGLYFLLEDLWEVFREWSAYGVEVPLVVNGNDSIKQYYVPYLSAIQLYAEPQRLRRYSEDSGAESSKETSSAGSSDSEADKRARGGNSNVISQRLNRLTLGERSTLSSSSDETEGCNTPGQLVYEYFEGALPHMRPPLHDMVSTLASGFPDLKKYRSCDLSPSSWFSVAWYPIYRIPVGSTLRNLDTSFLTFHFLSTHSKRKNQPQSHAFRKVHGVARSPNISLPVFALASYKLRGSILNSDGNSEWNQVNSLLQAAGDWLQNLQVTHPDYQHFVSRSSQGR